MERALAAPPDALHVRLDQQLRPVGREPVPLDGDRRVGAGRHQVGATHQKHPLPGDGGDLVKARTALFVSLHGRVVLTARHPADTHQVGAELVRAVDALDGQLGRLGAGRRDAGGDADARGADEGQHETTGGDMQEEVGGHGSSFGLRLMAGQDTSQGCLMRYRSAALSAGPRPCCTAPAALF